LRVFLDTNVLVSAFATRGLCADVLRLVLAEHTCLVGEVVIKEIERVLARRLRAKPAAIAELVAFLRDQEVVPRPKRPHPLRLRDESDRWILASAMAGRADVLVTGDRDLLDAAGEAPLPVVDPRGFWMLQRGASRDG
jgi:putative PIN family toxin of toxin-antitoxin system